MHRRGSTSKSNYGGPHTKYSGSFPVKISHNFLSHTADRHMNKRTDLTNGVVSLLCRKSKKMIYAGKSDEKIVLWLDLQKKTVLKSV